jgi:hypothetical protein
MGIKRTCEGDVHGFGPVRSWCAEHPGYDSNERLEFLGDAVVGLVVTDVLYRRFPEAPEGRLAKVRAAAVNTRSLAALAQVVESGVAEFGRLDIVVANAGVGAYGPFLELDPEHLEEIVDVNVKGVLYTAAATLEALQYIQHLLGAGLFSDRTHPNPVPAPSRVPRPAEAAEAAEADTDAQEQPAE